jgi:hypothetical protein
MRSSFQLLVLWYFLAAVVHTPHVEGAATIMKVGDNLKDSPEYNRCETVVLQDCMHAAAVDLQLLCGGCMDDSAGPT